jgi:hypothetical protein
LTCVTSIFVFVLVFLFPQEIQIQILPRKYKYKYKYKIYFGTVVQTHRHTIDKAPLTGNRSTKPPKYRCKLADVESEGRSRAAGGG